MAELFGFSIQKAKKDQGLSGKTFTDPTPDDGAIEIAGGGFFSSVLDTDGRERNDLDLIRRYRDISMQSECDAAVEDIVNEAIISNLNDIPVNIDLTNLKYGDKIKNRIRVEFMEVLRLLNFNEKGHDIFRRWYVDGRIYYHKVIDNKDPQKGLTHLRFIDPTKIRKVRETKKDPSVDQNGVEMVSKVDEYFIYSDKGFASSGSQGNDQGIKIAADSVVYVPSGLLDSNSGRVISHLHKAIKPVNQLRMIEDAIVIYRISRAPERRIFYIDVGNLPKQKAEQYLRDVMGRYRNKLVYDANTGEIRDDKKHMSMLEDFWLPRREGGRGTEITTLPGGQNLGEITDIEYFKKKLYRALNVPVSRLEGDGGFNLGRSSEILRDELKFSKFVGRLRKRFSNMFLDMLRTQLLLKNIVTVEDWESMSEHIQFDFIYDNHFSELKEAELLQERLNLIQVAEPYVGRYFSQDYVRRKILRQSDDEMIEQDDIIQKEIKQGVIADPYEMDMAVDGLGGAEPGQPSESAPAAGMDLGAPVTEPDLEKQGKSTESPDGGII